VSDFSHAGHAGVFFIRPVQRGVSKGVEDGCRLPTLQAGRPRNRHKAVLGVAHPQGIKGLSIAGQGETLGSLWILLAIRAYFSYGRS
tara:strand:+ start:311 stop:571 length:261 start_codon:yes stop_codon:yes gene_type:complete